MSEVYEAFDEGARRTVAVKLMLTGENIDARSAIFAEARSLLGFRHAHVVGLFGIGAVGSQPFVELELVSGGSLAEHMELSGVPPVADALSVLVKAADGLCALHEAGIVHRDIKADNVLLTDEGRPVIADFGLAMHRERLPCLPSSGIVGTPAYMSPEAILGITESFEHYSSSDQYSFGVTTYFALTGTLPFDAPTPSALFYAQMAVAPEPATARRAELPGDIDAVLRRALGKRARRPVSHHGRVPRQRLRRDPGPRRATASDPPHLGRAPSAHTLAQAHRGRKRSVELAALLHLRELPPRVGRVPHRRHGDHQQRQRHGITDARHEPDE